MEDIPLTTLPPALVISHGPGGLGTVRSLARCGVRVTVIAYDTRDPVLRSRYPVKKYIVPGDPTDKDSELLNLLRGLPADGAVLLFTSDQLVSLISCNDVGVARLQRQHSVQFTFSFIPTTMTN